MKLSTFMYFAKFGIKTIISGSRNPILGTIIVTDRCNLKCKHCAVNNITFIMHPYTQIKTEMRLLYDMGVRILFFSGGETFMWQDGSKTLRDLVIEAKKMGFLIVNAVTNGTFPIDLPEADLLLLSLDGNREVHNEIRGDTYDKILKNIENATADNILIYMAVNQINKNSIREVCIVAKNMKNVRAVSFNFHTPYPGTEELSLTKEDKEKCCEVIGLLKDEGFPIFNLKNAFPYVINNTFPRPCYQCVVIENGKLSKCARCASIDGLCQKCGYFFVAEYTLVFTGHVKVIWEMLRTYLKYV